MPAVTALISYLISYWKMDEGSGNALDAVSTNNGTISGTPTRNGSGVKLGYTFNGSNYINIGNVAELRTPKISVAGWFKMSPTGSNFFPIYTNYTYGSTPFGFSICSEGTYLRLEVNNSANSATIATTSNTINSGAWIHFACVVNGTNLKIYLNGTLQSLQEGGTSVPFAYDIGYSIGDGSFQIGHRLGDSLFMTGSIDEIGHWSRELTAAEVTQLYNSGSGVTYPFVGQTVNDNFDAYSVGALAGQGNWRTCLNTISVADTSGDKRAYCSFNGECCAKRSETFSNNQYSKVTFDSVAASSMIGPAVRCSGSGATANYYAYYAGGTGGSTIGVVTGGTWNNIADTIVSVVVGDTYEIRINGSVLEFYKNGILDSSLTSSGFGDVQYSGTPGRYNIISDIPSGSAGLSGFYNNTGTKIDLWEGGDIV